MWSLAQSNEYLLYCYNGSLVLTHEEPQHWEVLDMYRGVGGGRKDSVLSS